MFIVEGKVYDLREWVPLHPGGPLWFSKCFNRDITAVVYTYHKEPEMIKKILAKYEVKGKKAEAIEDPYFNVPRYVLPEDFNVKKDIMKFDFTLDSLFNRTLKALDRPEWKKEISSLRLLV